MGSQKFIVNEIDSLAHKITKDYPQNYKIIDDNKISDVIIRRDIDLLIRRLKNSYKENNIVRDFLTNLDSGLIICGEINKLQIEGENNEITFSEDELVLIIKISKISQELTYATDNNLENEKII